MHLVIQNHQSHYTVQFLCSILQGKLHMANTKKQPDFQKIIVQLEILEISQMLFSILPFH